MAVLLAATALCSVQHGRAQVIYGNGDNIATTLTLTAPTTVFVDPGLATQSGVVDESGGAFGVVKIGDGTLALTNPANSYSGGTTINQGAISIASDANLGNAGGGLVFGGGSLIVTGSFTSARAITLNAGGGTIDTGGNTLTLIGDIGGAGGLTKRGAGELLLMGANATYSGVTRIEEGVLTAGGFLSTSAASLHQIGVDGTLRVLDTMIAEVGLLSGAGRIELLGQSALSTGNIAGTAVFSGVIDGASGTGSLQHLGSGTQILTGLGSALGGSLSICGCSTGAPLILRGGSLSVAGTIAVQGGTLRIDQAAVVSAASVLVQTSGGSAILDILSGGRLTSGGANLGTFVAGGPTTALVSGAGSSWTIGGSGLAIDPFSNTAATFTVADGGRIATGDLLIGSLGVLRLGAGGLAGAIDASAILSDGAIIADFTDTATIAASIGPYNDATPGTLTKRGQGVLTLTGTNTYTGNTTLEGGVLSVSSDANLGVPTSGLVLNGGVLRVTGTAFTQAARPISFGSAGGGFDIADAANTFTVTQDFGGAGGVSKAGAGALVLAGVHSYSGATSVTGGTLRAGAAGSLSPSSAFTVAAGATLSLGGFNQSIGSLAGAGAAAIGAATLTIGGNDSSTIFSGAISGTGGLVKTGSGALSLTGTSPFTGATRLDAGALIVNGSLAGSVVTLNGGTLGGTGTVGGVNARANSTVAPGNSIGALTVAGNVAFGPGSTYRVETNAAGAADRINASGTALLTGGLVQVLAEQGVYALSTRYVILAAQGGVSGRFAGLTSNLAFLTPTLTYEANDVVLTLARNDVAFAPPPAAPPPAAPPPAAPPAADGGAMGVPAVAVAAAPTRFVAITRNQTGVGRVAETLGAGNRVYGALISSTVAEARAGFDALSGEAHAQGVAVAIETSHLLREAVLNRLRAPFETSVSLGTMQGAFSADLPGGKGGVALPAPRIETRRVTLWGEAIGAAGRSAGDGNAGALERRGGGMLVGAELESGGVSPWRIGALAGFTRHHVDIDARRSSGTQDAVHAALYGGAKLGAFSLRAGAAYAWNETDLTRQVLLRGFSDVLRHDGNGSTTQGFAEIGYDLRMGAIAFEPFAQIAWVHLRNESGTEQGGAAALRVNGSSRNLGFTTLGLRAEAQIVGMPLFARGMLGWRHAFGETTPGARLAFASGGAAFDVYAAPVARDALMAEAGLSWRVSGMTSLGVAYSAALAESQRDHALKGRLDVRF